MTIDGQYTAIGKYLPRVDGVAKVTGAAKYAADINMPRMLYCDVVRSPYPHAKILKIDTSAAEKLPGVKNVITGDYYAKRGGLYLADKNFLAHETAKYRGEAVVAVCAETPEIAHEACKLVKIDYEELPAVLSPMDAMKPDAPLVHPELETYRVAPIFHPVPGTNISHKHFLKKGDTEAAFKKCDKIVEHEYYVPHVQHCPIETHTATVKFDQSGNLTVWASCQSPYAVRNALSDSFDIPLHKIQIISEFVGGGFGAKAGTTIEGIIIPLAQLNVGRPVKFTYTREEEFRDAYVRQGMLAKIKTGVDKTGKILAVENNFYWDGGAYNEYGVNIAKAAGFASAGPYNIDNITTNSYCLYTNHPVGGPYRGFGMCEIHFCIEQNLDVVANEIGISPIEIRRINGLRPGDKTGMGEVMKVSGYQPCLETVLDKLKYDPTPKKVSDHKIRCMGVAAGWKSPSQPTDAGSASIIRMNEDGTFYVHTSAEEIGQGSNTALTQIAAEVLNVNPSRITLKSGDTNMNPYEWQTVASRTTYCAGNAVKLAAEDLKKKIFDLAQMKLGYPARDMYLERDDEHDCTWVVASKYHRDMRVDIKTFALGMPLDDGSGIGGPAIGVGTFTLPNNMAYNAADSQSEKGVAFWTIGCTGVEIEIDTQTGHVKVLQMISCFDPGKVINTELYAAQVEGAMIQSLGTALYEAMILKDGKLMNGSFLDYKIPTAYEMPDVLESYVVEFPEETGPFGARGIGEPAMVPGAPAIANAIANALGVRFNQMPITPDMVLETINNKKN